MRACGVRTIKNAGLTNFRCQGGEIPRGSAHGYDVVVVYVQLEDEFGDNPIVSPSFIIRVTMRFLCNVTMGFLRRTIVGEMGGTIYRPARENHRCKVVLPSICNM